MEGNINEQQTVLCEINDMISVVFLSENDLIVDHKTLTHRLKYFENFEGEKDVIRYSRCNNSNIVSYYTIRNGIALCGSMKDGEIDWKYVPGMTNFVITRFKAFNDYNVKFVKDEINQLLSRPYMRIKNR